MNEKLLIEKKRKSNRMTINPKALAVSEEVYEKVMAIREKTGWSAKEITDKLILFALDNVEIK